MLFFPPTPPRVPWGLIFNDFTKVEKKCDFMKFSENSRRSLLVISLYSCFEIMFLMRLLGVDIIFQKTKSNLI